MKRITHLLALAVIVLLSLAGSSFAEISKTLNFQGRLTDKGGNPLTGSYSLGFSLYAVSSGGSPLWSETQTVSVSEGIYSCLLGSVTALNLNFNQPYYLEVSVSGQTLSPRQPLSASAYAFNAQRLDGVTSNEFLRLDAKGRVGISTTNPSDIFHVHGGNLWNSQIFGTGAFDGPADMAYLGFNAFETDTRGVWDTVSGSWDGAVLAVFTGNTDQGTSMRFGFVDQANGSESTAMTVRKDGNIGIGTTQPNQLLHVSGSAKTVLFEDTHPSSGMVLRLLSSNALPTNASGRIDFGDAANNLMGYLRYDHTTSGAATDFLAFGTAANGNVANGERMRITSTGNVGIGTTSPTLPGIKTGGPGRITTSGKVLQVRHPIGSTEHAAVVDVSAGIVEGFFAAGFNGRIKVGSLSNHDFVLMANNQDVVTIDSDTTFVGIGTTAPVSKLHVQGSATIEGSFLKIPVVSQDPANTQDGMLWYNSSSGTFKCKQKGQIKTFALQ